MSVWDESYTQALHQIPMFDPEVTARWSPAQRQYFAAAFYHVRGHFGEVLWELGNVLPTGKLKNIVLDNIREEFGGDGPNHRSLYVDICKELGIDLTREHLENKYNFSWIRQYNEVQVRAAHEQGWRLAIIGFAVGEHLDNIDFVELRSIFESFGIERKQLHFFNEHADAEHFAGALEQTLHDEWDRDPDQVQAAFHAVRYFQIDMWTKLSAAVSAQAEAPASNAAAHAHVNGTGSLPRLTSITAESPRFRTKFADVTALNAGDASELELVFDDAARARMKAYREPFHWGEQVLVFGGNGFVGAHFVHRLLADPKVKKVYAIVRAKAGLSPADRVYQTWAKYSLNRGSVDLTKLQVLDGTMSAPLFGLDEQVHDTLNRNVDTIFQCSGSTDYSPSYLDLRDQWVLGLLNVLRFCLSGKLKQITYLGSTIAHLYRTPEDFQRPDSWWYSGYTQMKWVNQQMMASAARAGMRAVVCEAPYVLGGTVVGKDPGYEYSFWREIGLGAALQLAWDGPFPHFAAVDVLADAVVKNMLSANPLEIIRPIAPYSLTNADVAPLLNCKVVPWNEFLAQVHKYADADQLRMIPNDMPQLVSKTNLPGIYPSGYDLGAFPPSQQLATLYLRNLNLI